MEKTPVYFSKICLTVSHTIHSLEIETVKKENMHAVAIIGLVQSDGETNKITFRCDQTLTTDRYQKIARGVAVTGNFDSLKKTLAVFCNILKNASIGELAIDIPDREEVSQQYRTNVMKEIGDELRRFNQKIAVNLLNLAMPLTENDILEFISFVQEDKLKNLEFELAEDSTMSQLTESTLWGNLACANILKAWSIPVGKFAHFSYCIVDEASADLEELKQLINVSFLINTSRFSLNLFRSCFNLQSSNWLCFRTLITISINFETIYKLLATPPTQTSLPYNILAAPTFSTSDSIHSVFNSQECHRKEQNNFWNVTLLYFEM